MFLRIRKKTQRITKQKSWQWYFLLKVKRLDASLKCSYSTTWIPINRQELKKKLIKYIVVYWFKHLFVGCNTVIQRSWRRGVDFLYYYCLWQTAGLRYLNGSQHNFPIHRQILRHGFSKQRNVIFWNLDKSLINE